MNGRNPWGEMAQARVSDRWTTASARWNTAITEALLAAAKLTPASIVLDVATGSGDPALTIAEHLTTGKVIAIDSSSAVELAEKRARELGLELKMTCLQADAQAIPLQANSVDRITCRFGVMFIDDFALAAYDMLRVLKHGGRIALLVWGPFVQPFFDATVGVVLQRLPGTGMPPEAQKMFRFAAPGSLDRELRAAGFSDVHEERLTLPRIWAGTSQDLWDYQQEISTLCHPLYAAIPLPLKQEVDARVSFELARFADGDVLSVPVNVVIATAMKVAE
jgi:ubiquinone/menaquinone biosynthesis C-methylase UbiE